MGKHLRRICVSGASLCAAIACGTATLTPAAASPNSPNVTVGGRAAACGPNTTVTRVLIQTANGEAADDHVAGKGPGLFGVYSVSFHRVPKNGETAFAYVFCTDFSARTTSYGNQIRITRPAVGNLQLVWLTH